MAMAYLASFSQALWALSAAWMALSMCANAWWRSSRASGVSSSPEISARAFFDRCQQTATVFLNVDMGVVAQVFAVVYGRVLDRANGGINLRDGHVFLAGHLGVSGRVVEKPARGAQIAQGQSHENCAFGEWKCHTVSFGDYKNGGNIACPCPRPERRLESQR